MPNAQKYGVGFAFSTQLRKAGLADFATGSDWTPVAGDVKVAKSPNGSEANIGTLPSYANGTWTFTLTATEAQAAPLYVRIRDAATKAVDDADFEIYMFGNASANYPPDYANSTNLGMANLDVTVSSRMATFTYTAPPSAANIAAQITIDHGSGSYVGGGPAITIDNDAIEITG